ncbi:uncharacterized protein V1518DRAFT_414322 [Limtongia smithiae]|uniref:uncharacterized protein n=1 Tax=Limtongia smithiae TaxID=1125753 RepID=UPI0034D01CE7
MDLDRPVSGIIDSSAIVQDDTDTENMYIDTPNTPGSPVIAGPQLPADMKIDPPDLPVIPRADDYATMKQLLYQQMDDDLEIQIETQAVWHVQSWKELERRIHGPPFRCGDFEWKILLFPAGNQAGDNMSMYLECAYAPEKDETAPAVADEDEEKNWAVCAMFGLVMSNYHDPTIFEEHHSHHRFSSEEKDWGFSKFYEQKKLFAKHKDKSLPLIENDKVDITAFVRIIKDPTGVLWHNFINYNSKKETGYVGLRNQGATCYMNSLLQSLYFTTAFRKAVYEIPTENDTPTSSVPLALQRVFYHLQNSQTPVGTLELTRSFGWDTMDAFTQHDVQEFNRVLMDNLEGKMKGTKVEKALAELFVGQMKSYVKCINVDFESSRSEDFWDIQLNVKRMKDLQASFKDYVQVETLDGENQYMATGHGLQDAEKGVIFQTFPPVLNLQLKRFEYDFMRDMMVKINDRHEFPAEIDLQEFLVPEAPRDEPWVYVLHGVLVHSGDLNAGHYYALLKPEKDGKWFRFDDDRVTRATEKEVLEDNYGEDKLKRHSNAYMLVYLRKSRLDKILAPMKAQDTPHHIPERIEREVRDEQARVKAQQEQYLYMRVLIMGNRQFKHYHGFDIAQWKQDDSPIESLPMSFRVLKKSTVKDLRDAVAKELKIENPSRLRFWLVRSRGNQTERPEIALLDSVPLAMEQVRSAHKIKSPELCFWMEEADVDPESNEVLHSLADGTESCSKIQIFLKHFDPHTQTLSGVTSCVVAKNDKVTDMTAHINSIMRWPNDTLLDYYEETQSPVLVEPIEPPRAKQGFIDAPRMKQTFAQLRIKSGDIVVFQRRLTEQEIQAIKGYPDIPSFYDFLWNRVLVTFRPRSAAMENRESFDLYLRRNDAYAKMAEKVGEHLDVDPTHLRFTTTQPMGRVRNTLSSTTQQEVQQMIVANSVILYEILDMSLSDLETKRVVRVTWLSEGISQEHQYEVLVPQNGNMRDVLDILKVKANLSDEVASRVRFYGAHMNKIYKPFSESYLVLSLQDGMPIYAEEIPEEELNLAEDERVIQVFHFQKEPNRTHGIPFWFVLKPDEKFVDTKARLQTRTGIRDRQFEKIKFALVRQHKYSEPLYLNDEQVVAQIAEVDDALGMDHLDKTTYKNLRHEQRAIFIKN